MIFNLQADEAGAPVLAWSPRKDGDCPAVAAAREAAREGTMEEYRRLLYVALTRAEERLYLSGFHGARGPEAQCWAGMITAAFADDPATTRHPRALGRERDDPAPVRTRRARGVGRRRHRGAPDGRRRPASAWLTRAAPRREPGRATIRPSHTQLPAAPSAGPGGTGLAFGLAVHGLLQYLPDLPEDRRRAAALATLDARGELTPPAAAAAVAQALGVLALPALAPLFAAGAHAEVAVLGHVSRPDGSTFEVPGKVDRLAVDGDTVYAVDFKTGTPCCAGRHAGVATSRRWRCTGWSWRRSGRAERLRMRLVWTADARVVRPAGLRS